ncbi:tail fiber domain-containing protein [Cupriavidus basilensis]|uniref:tail fiber domain-containing protein n=1 Tax=Cupriavidus basilensis TaxID=68895 RepID=UPI0020A692CF|nr:tail fiber domain-containing protein [Cupriavidus basilensis]MCP3023258.1 tail fiber domain-containing protein [Cupriavidus basilensis]
MTTSVTYPANIGGDNITIDDSDSTTTGLGNGGHRTRFMIAMAQFVKVADWVRATAQTVLGYRDAAATSASQAQIYAAAAQASAGAPALAGNANKILAVNSGATGVAWVQSLPSLTVDLMTGKTTTLTHTAPLVRYVESDQSGAVGVFQTQVDGGTYALLRNTAAARDFSTYVAEYQVTSAGRQLFGGATDDGATKHQFGGDTKVTGVLTASTVTAANVTGTSDRRLKHAIEPLSDALDTVKRLRGVRFSWLGDDSGRRDVGVIAQELQDVLPELVFEGTDGNLSVAYANLTAVLIEAIKEQDVRLAALEGR